MLPDLDSLRCFVEAARVLNFRAAARAVHLTPAALGQRIRKLEGDLGVVLFRRTTRTVQLTEAGLALVPVARRAIEAAAACAPAARGDLGPVQMDLVVGTRHELGLSWLVPLLPRLRREQPGITFHLYFGSGPDLELRIRHQAIDCAVSSRRVTDPKLDTLDLHREDYAFVASPKLLLQRPFARPEHAARHVLVDASDELDLFRYFRDAPGGSDSLEFAGLIRMGAIAAMRALVLAGDGVAVLPEYLVAKDLAAHRLVRVLPKVALLHDFFRLVFRADDPKRSIYQSLAKTLASEPLR